MRDFMDTALNYEPGIRIAPGSKWVMTNGTIQMDVCTVCGQPYREGHIDCTCPSNHAERCERPTYDQLKAQHDALVAAIEKLYSYIDYGKFVNERTDDADFVDTVIESLWLEQVK